MIFNETSPFYIPELNDELKLFLDKALQHTLQVRDILHNIPNTGTRLQHIRDTADAVSKASSLRDSYYHIVEALTNIESLIITENLSKADREAVQQQGLRWCR